MNRLTTITIRGNNYKRLKNLGRTGESFNDVLTRILDRVKLDEIILDQLKDGESNGNEK